MAFYLIPHASTDWVREAARREGESNGGFERAIARTTRDVNTAARSAAGTGYNAASARDAAQALAPEVSRLRSDQATELNNVRAGWRADQQAEANRSNEFMNNLLGGLAGMAGQMMVPAIGAMTGGAGAPVAAGLGNMISGGMGGAPGGGMGSALGLGAPRPPRPPRPPFDANAVFNGAAPAAGGPGAAGGPPGAAGPPPRLPGETDEEYARRTGMGG